MRVMECNHDRGEELSQKQYLRPLMPKPFTNITAFSATPTPSCFQLHNPNYISGGVGGYGVIKREMSTVAAPLVSSRWNPTPEQLQALEEMYKRGTRTPSAEQIQQIAAKLRRFGKIEGKNVFYWFQNHKARERQKKRRQQELLAARKMRQVEKPEVVTKSGLSRRYLEFEHPKKVPTPSNCSTVLENYVEECKKDVWAQLDEKEQLQTITAKSTETCSPLELSSCMPFNCSKQQQQITAHKTLGQENENPFVPIITNLRNLYRSDDLGDNNNAASGIIREDQTLQLFPVRGNGGHVINVGADDAEEDDQTNDDVLSLDTKLVPRQFFEFLPTRK